jgi:hypothetical protein
MADKREAIAALGLLLLHEHCSASAASASFGAAALPNLLHSASTTCVSPFLLEYSVKARRGEQKSGIGNFTHQAQPRTVMPSSSRALHCDPFSISSSAQAALEHLSRVGGEGDTTTGTQIQNRTCKRTGGEFHHPRQQD